MTAARRRKSEISAASAKAISSEKRRKRMNAWRKCGEMAAYQAAMKNGVIGNEENIWRRQAWHGEIRRISGMAEKYSGGIRENNKRHGSNGENLK